MTPGPALPQCLEVHHGCPPGAEPLVHPAGRHGVLILHGFTGSPWEVLPLAQALADRDWTVALPVLAGHATTVHALDETHWHDWLGSARQALAWLDGRCDRVDLVGMSMGSLLCLLLAQAREPSRGGRVVLLAPALGLVRWQRWGIQGMARLGWPAVLGKADPRLPGGIQPPGYQALPLRATQAFLELTQVVRATVRPSTRPILALHGTADRTIPHALAQSRARELLGMHLDWRSVPGAGHLLLRDRAAAQVVAQVVEFLAQPEA